MTKFWCRFGVLALALGLAACREGGMGDFKGGSPDDPHTPLAIVDADTITLKMFNDNLNDRGWHRGEFTDTLKFKQDALHDLIVDLAAKRAAYGLPAPDDSEFQVRLREHSSGLMRRLLYKDKILSKLAVTPAEIDSFYQANSDRYVLPERLRVAHILLSTSPVVYNREGQHPVTPAEADSLAREKLALVQQKLADGVDFGDLARQYSDDNTSSANGGDLGYLSRGQLPGELDSAAFTLPLNTISGPLHSQYGYHLIRATDRLREGLAPLDSSLTESIRGELMRQQSQTLAADYYDSLVKATKIDYNQGFIDGVDRLTSPQSWVVILNGRDTVYRDIYLQWERGEKAKLRVDSLDRFQKRELLQSISGSAVLYFEARHGGYDQTPDYQKERDDFIYTEKLNRFFAGRQVVEYEPTDSEIAEYYMTHPKEFAEEPAVAIMQVIVPDRAAALQVKAEVDSGGDFQQVAMKYFPGDVDEIKQMAINLGWITPLELSQEFFNQVFRLQVGQVSEPIKTEWGYHVVKVTGKRDIKPLETVKPDIRKELILARKAQVKAAWDRRLLKGRQIKVDEALLAQFLFRLDWIPKVDITKLIPRQ